MTALPTLPLVKESNTGLYEAISPIDLTQDGIKDSLADVAYLMHNTRIKNKAIGLAANQCGVKLRMFVMGNAAVQFTCINPEIITASEKTEIMKEGCLSFPGLLLNVKRPSEISVKYYDENLNLVECSFTGALAKCFQHELDHLNGVTFTEHVSKLVLAMGRKKQAKHS